MSALYTHTTRAPGTILTATIYNADHQNHIDNGVPAMLDDYSVNASQMQSQVDPFPGGVASLPTSLAAELERIRFVLAALKGTSYWYEAGAAGLTFIEGKDPAGVADITFENGFAGDYKHHLYFLTQVVPATSAQVLVGQVKMGGAYITANYQYHLAALDASSAAYNSGVSTGAAHVLLSAANENNVSSALSGVVLVSNILPATGLKTMLSLIVGRTAAGNLIFSAGGGGQIGTFTALQGMKFKFAAGNITSGRIAQFGVRG